LDLNQEETAYMTIGNGKKALFWEAAWLEGLHPKDVAPLIFLDLQKEENNGVQSPRGWVLGFPN
jgi:hypothetical protein